MAHDPADGPLGLEGRHQFKSGDQMPPGANNEASVFMYGRHRPDLGSAWIKIDTIPGLHAGSDGDDFREAAEGRTGEIVYPSAQRGKTIVYTGRVTASGRTLAGLKAQRVQAAALRRIFAETRERVTGSITIVDPGNTGQGYATRVRGMQFEMDDEQKRPLQALYPWQREFMLSLRAHDSRFIWYPEASSLAHAAGDTVPITNLGTAPADLVFDVRASGTPMSVTMENLTLGRRLVWTDMPMPAAAYTRLLRVDWRQRAAVRPAQAAPVYAPNTDMMPYFDSFESDWWNSMEWGLGPGLNNIRVTGVNVAGWDVYYQHTAY